MVVSALGWVGLLGATHVAVTWLRAVRDGRGARRRPMLVTPPAADWPTVSVIVPAWNDGPVLARCIGALRDVDYPSLEVIVVAGGSDSSLELAIQLTEDLAHATVVEQQPRGKNAALNQGLLRASGTVLVLLDADSVVAPGWLRELVRPIDEQTVATTGWASPSRRTWVSRSEEMENLAARYVDRSAVLNGNGSIAVRRDVIERLGGFAEDVMVGVDWDLDRRLLAAGLRRVFSPGARVLTERPATLREYWVNELRWRRAHFASILRHDLKPGVMSPTGLGALYVYALAWLMLALTSLAALVILAGPAEMKAPALAGWVGIAGWIGLRRAAVAIKVAAYTGDVSWLRVAHVPPLLLTLSLCAIVPAMLTVRRISPHFKGPRPVQPLADVD